MMIEVNRMILDNRLSSINTGKYAGSNEQSSCCLCKAWIKIDTHACYIYYSVQLQGKVNSNKVLYYYYSMRVLKINVNKSRVCK